MEPIRVIAKGPLRPQVSVHSRSTMSLRGPLETLDPSPAGTVGVDNAQVGVQRHQAEMQAQANSLGLARNDNLLHSFGLSTVQQQQQAAVMMAYWNMCSIYNAAYKGSMMKQQMNFMQSQLQSSGNPMARQPVFFDGKLNGQAEKEKILPQFSTIKPNDKQKRRADKFCNVGEERSKVSKKSGSFLANKICSNCGTSSTPFWRKNKNGGLPLCNACGLYFAKNEAPRPKELWKEQL